MTLRSWIVGLSALACVSAAGGCSSSEVSDDESESEDAITAGTVCTRTAARPNQPLAEIIRAAGGEVGPNDTPVIHNFTAWPAYAPNAQGGAYDPAIVAAKATSDEARKNLARGFGECDAAVQKHLKKRPNIYVYFTGFGGATQNNSVLDDGAVLRWINQRDPKGLIFSINWSCADSHDAWCKDNAVKLLSGESSPEHKYMTQTINAVAPQAMGTVQQILGATAANQEGYNTALSHGMQLAALLVDQLLVADSGTSRPRLGNFHFLGYSMGAHAAAQVLIQDFVGDGTGFKWTRPGQCDDGGDVCTIAHLKKTNWSLSLGASGWSEALLSHNKFDAEGRPGRDAGDIAQNRNGGLLRIEDARFNGKANIFNRRMDPTSNSDDTFQRGFGDIFFGDYNHYAHDYAMPLFVNDGFLRVLDAFLENKNVKSSPELGAVYDNAGLVEFDDCSGTGPCNASTGYLAHAVNRSHERLVLAHTVPVTTTDGVPHPEKAKNLAVAFGASSQPIVLNTFDQEDLRGGVELYLRPRFATNDAGTHGLFSYGACTGSTADLMPQAFVKGGNVYFTMNYQGAEYTADVPVAQASLSQGKWTHLAFTWDLPVVSMASVRSPTLAADAANDRYGQGIILATGLRKPLPTTYHRQEGVGTLRIYANGAQVAEAALGTASSKRDCLLAAEVLSSNSYVVDGQTFPAFSPYARYDQASGDVVSMGGAPLGKKCKAYKVRNQQAFFGCAQNATVNAEADMDDIMLVYGPGRTAYDNVERGTGAPKIWPIGPAYTSQPHGSR